MSNYLLRCQISDRVTLVNYKECSYIGTFKILNTCVGNMDGNVKAKG